MADGDVTTGAPTQAEQRKAQKKSGGPDAVSEGASALVEASKKGYLGFNPVEEAIPNKRYGLQTGPDGVPLHEEIVVANTVHAYEGPTEGEEV
jgi:hypothetical protein